VEAPGRFLVPSGGFRQLPRRFGSLSQPSGNFQAGPTLPVHTHAASTNLFFSPWGSFLGISVSVLGTFLVHLRLPKASGSFWQLVGAFRRFRRLRESLWELSWSLLTVSGSFCKLLGTSGSFREPAFPKPPRASQSFWELPGVSFVGASGSFRELLAACRNKFLQFGGPSAGY
jgi:hypothetical protein